jgi:hypothetical protein
MRLELLPLEVLLMVLKYVDIVDISELCLLNQEWNRILKSNEVWNYLFFQRFRRECADVDAKKAYRIEDSLLRFKGARDLHIAWSDDERYWRLEDTQDSKSGSIAILRVVFWMHVIAQFEGVMPGRYQPKIRLFTADWFWLSGYDTVFIIDSVSEGYHEEVSFSELRHQIHTRAFAEVELPPIQVTRPNTTVTVQIKETNNDRAKQGLFLDYVQLKVYNETTVEQPHERKLGVIGTIINAASRFLFGQ